MNVYLLLMEISVIIMFEETVPRLYRNQGGQIAPSMMSKVVNWVIKEIDCEIHCHP